MSTLISQHRSVLHNCRLFFFSVFLLYLIMSVNHVVPHGNGHRVAELVVLPTCGRAKMPKEVQLFFVVVYKVQGKKNHFGCFENVS